MPLLQILGIQGLGKLPSTLKIVGFLIGVGIHIKLTWGTCAHTIDQLTHSVIYLTLSYSACLRLHISLLILKRIKKEWNNWGQFFWWIHYVLCLKFPEPFRNYKWINTQNQVNSSKHRKWYFIFLSDKNFVIGEVWDMILYFSFKQNPTGNFEIFNLV